MAAETGPGPCVRGDGNGCPGAAARPGRSRSVVPTSRHAVVGISSGVQPGSGGVPGHRKGTIDRAGPRADWPEQWQRQRAVESREILRSENIGYLIRALHGHGLPTPRDDREQDVIGRMADTLSLAEAVYLIKVATLRAHNQLRQRRLANVREACNQVLDRLDWYLDQITNGKAEPKALTGLPAPCSMVATTFFCTALGRASALHERAEPLDPPQSTKPTR